MKLAIVGSRKVLGAIPHVILKGIISNIIGYWYERTNEKGWDKTYIKEPFVVITGREGYCDGGGVDTVVSTFCQDAGHTLEVYEPLFERWEFYKKRNMDMVEACDIMYGILTSKSKTYGANWTCNYAEKSGKEVHRIVID